MPDTKICGHDRAALRKALEFANALDLDGISRGWPQPDSTHGALLFDIHDPAKLAAIIAELLRERGLSVKTDPQYDCQWLVFADEYDAVSIVAPRFAKAITMPQARAFALALLDAPNATAQDVERMIGEATR